MNWRYEEQAKRSDYIGNHEQSYHSAAVIRWQTVVYIDTRENGDRDNDTIRDLEEGCNHYHNSRSAKSDLSTHVQWLAYVLRIRSP